MHPRSLAASLLPPNSHSMPATGGTTATARDGGSTDARPLEANAGAISGVIARDKKERIA